MDKPIENLGDVDYITHGGFFVFADGDIEILEEPSDDEDEDAGQWTVYRLTTERHTYQDGGDCKSPEHCNGECRARLAEGRVLSDNEFHAGCPAWYADKLESIGQTMDVEPAELISDLCSDDVLRRALAYRDLVLYFGPFEFDQYPETFTREEIETRYAGWPDRI